MDLSIILLRCKKQEADLERKENSLGTPNLGSLALKQGEIFYSSKSCQLSCEKQTDTRVSTVLREQTLLKRKS